MSMLQKIANGIRHLTMDATELAGSGHPGLPMGCAEIGADGLAISLDWFGESGSSTDLAARFRYTKAAILQKIRAYRDTRSQVTPPFAALHSPRLVTRHQS